jgi:hypothetical protein
MSDRSSVRSKCMTSAAVAALGLGAALATQDSAPQFAGVVAGPGLSGTVQQTAGSIMLNLYTNPQEDDMIGVRHIPLGIPLLPEMQRYQAVLQKFPPSTRIALPRQ